MVAHFEERSLAQHGKAMVVAMSRDICAHLYAEFVKLRPAWHDDDPERGAIKIVMTGSASDKALLRPHLYSPKQKKRLEARFQQTDDPLRIVIVRDMWLTGFDAPCVHTLERLLEGEIRSRFASNVVQNRKFPELQADVVQRYRNRSIEAAQVMEELVQMARRFREAASRSDVLGRGEDEVRFYDALIQNESAGRELSDETLKRIAHELTESLRRNLSVDWSTRESVQAKLRPMVKRILRNTGYPPDHQGARWNWCWSRRARWARAGERCPADHSTLTPFQNATRPLIWRAASLGSG